MITIEQEIGELLIKKSLTLSIAESCTGGLLSHRITNVPGSSAYFEYSVVCYSKAAKTRFLGVKEGLIEQYGTVSAEVTQAMAQAVRKRAKTSFGLAVTGVAGTDSMEGKSAGLVYVALSFEKGVCSREFKFSGSREEIKDQASSAALSLLREHLQI
ncbi:MAG: CinA family protein [Nitrospirae bacterium]|nr:CinA family protein [Nitrospirota bacterium]